MTQSKRTLSVVVVLMVLMAAAAGVAFGGESISVSNGLTAAGGPLAIHGFDAVSYHDDGGPRRGLAKHSTKWDDAVYRFANEKSLRKFKRNPGKYAPQFGGFCAYGTSVGKKFDGDPEVYRIVGGKLYFNLNPDIKATWEKDLQENIEKAEKKWPAIKDKPASAL